MIMLMKSDRNGQEQDKRPYFVNEGLNVVVLWKIYQRKF